jgi:hypothetical protein
VSLIHITGLTAKMHGNDGAGARTDFAGCVANVDIHGTRLDVYQHGTRPEILDDLTGGGEGHRGDQNFVPALNGRSIERQVQRSRARAHSDGVSRSDVGGKLPFEFDGFRSHGEPPGANDLGDGGNFFFANRRSMEGNIVNRF